MTLGSKEVESALKRKGFVPRSGDHRYIFYMKLDGKITEVHTKTSHSGGDLNDWLIKQMSKQIKLDKAKFKQFVDCKLKQTQYEKILIDGDHI